MEIITEDKVRCFVRKQISRPITIKMFGEGLSLYKFTKMTPNDFKSVNSKTRGNNLVEVELSQEAMDMVERTQGFRPENLWLMREEDANFFFDITYENTVGIL